MLTTKQMAAWLFLSAETICAALRLSHEGCTVKVIAEALEDEGPAEWRERVQDYLLRETAREDYGVFLRSMRLAGGLTQEDIAQKLGKHKQSVSNYETDKQKLSLEKLIDLIGELAPSDRQRQLRELAMRKDLDGFLDVLHII